MPKISDYELEHMTFDQTFEKFRRKSKPLKEVKYSEKKKHREKKIDFWEFEDTDEYSENN